MPADNSQRTGGKKKSPWIWVILAIIVIAIVVIVFMLINPKTTGRQTPAATIPISAPLSLVSPLGGGGGQSTGNSLLGGGGFPMPGSLPGGFLNPVNMLNPLATIGNLFGHR